MVKLGSNCITCYRYLKAPEKCMYVEAQQLCFYAGKIGEVPKYGSKEITYPQLDNDVLIQSSKEENKP